MPLAFAGFPHADGRILGFALAPSADGLMDDPGFRAALRAIAPMDGGTGRRVLRLHRFGLTLSPTLEPAKVSLDPALYTATSSTFASVTPIVLDRHLKQDGPARQTEIAAQIAAACRNIGLPDPQVVVPDKHSAVEGAVSAEPAGRSPDWMRWRLPTSLASRTLTHAVIRFSERVDGPMILGAGRFVGLGLCRPVDAEGPHVP